MAYNFSHVWLSVRLYLLKDFNIGSSYLHIQCISMEYESSLYLKVIRSRSSHRSKKGWKWLFLQCKTSSSHNCSSITSIKYRALRFASSMGFSAMADQMLWLPCHVTGSDHALVNVRITGCLALDLIRRESCSFIFTMQLYVMQCSVLSRPFFHPSMFLSVCQTCALWQNETCAHIIIPHERYFILVFRQEEWLVTGDPLYLNFCLKLTVLEQKTLIFYTYSLVTPQP